MYRKRFLCSFSLFVLGLLLYSLGRFLPGFSDFYIAHVYTITAGLFARIFSLFPFSAVEFMLYGFCLFLVFYPLFIWGCFLRRKEKVRPKKIAASYFSALVFLLSLLWFLYSAHCGVNYYRTDFASDSGFTAADYTGEELLDYCSYLTGELNEVSAFINKDASGRCLSSDDFFIEGSQIMADLGKVYPSLGGFYPRAKPVSFSEILSWQHLCGIYSPFTVEANVNADMPGFYIPFTVCHELSHLKGYMQEEEANFISYLACTESGNMNFRYSGLLLAYIYAMDELYQYDRAGFADVRKLLCETASLDIQANSLFWHQYDGKIAEVSSQINDSYLKANSQTDGIASYNRVVGLMIAHYRTLIKL